MTGCGLDVASFKRFYFCPIAGNVFFYDFYFDTKIYLTKKTYLVLSITSSISLKNGSSIDTKQKSIQVNNCCKKTFDISFEY